MKKSVIYVWGANNFSQLGLNKQSEYELPTKLILDIAIQKIAAGVRHTIILDVFGDLYLAGKSDFSISGKSFEGIFKKLNLQHKFKNVSCGYDVSAAITQSNKLLAWGYNSRNLLGSNNNNENMSTIKEPTELPLPNDEVPIDVKFGLKHTAILTSSNKIFIVGLLKHFKNSPLTIIVHNSIEWLELIPGHMTITHFSCGQNHTSFVLDGHTIHSYGDNKFGQCSQIERTSEKIVKFDSGWTHNAYLTESNSLFLYGRNNYGQLGNGEKVSHGFTAEPHKCPLYPINDFAIGAEHGILQSGNDIYTWGWNEHRNCGHDTDDDVLEPKLLHLCTGISKIVSLVAGTGYCMVLLELDSFDK